ncbi:MAG: carbohydrate ABC transporter substrate-binding protein [Bauldia sp.]|nr:carbohydrate ABC transporter substrate-binding protein [Bauldia sp.]
MKTFVTSLLGATALAALVSGPALATDLEVIHWWTSKGESAAVNEFAKAFDNDGQGDHWVDSAIALGETARATVMQRALGGDPPGAAQFNPGRQYEELIAGGLLLQLDDVAEAGDWAGVIRPQRIQSACLVDGHWYCVPVNIHSWPWGWYSTEAFAKAGVPNPKNFDEFVAAAPKLQEAGIIPMAIGGDGNGWQIKGAFDQILLAALGIEERDQMYRDKDTEIAGSANMLKALQNFKALKQYTDEGYANRNWNDTTNLVITGKAGLQIMGDWARGEFAAAGMTGVEDFGCMIGLNEDQPIVSTDGDVIVFFKQDDPEVEAAQKRLAALLISPEVQVAFNNKKGSMPVRGDVDMATADPCMQKALKAVEDPAKIATGVQRLTTEDTNNELNSLVTQYWSDDSMTAEDAQARWVEILENAS